MHSSIDLAQIATALQKEWEHAKREHQHKEQRPFKERVLCGISWPALVLRNQENTRERTQLIFSSESPLHDGLSRGDLLSLSPKESFSPRIKGICIECDEYSCTFQIEKFEALPRWLLASPVALTKDFDDRTFQRYAQGIELLQQIDSPLKQQLLRGYEPPTPSNHSVSLPR